jgi:3-isopropylmalate/(R)-2-methylmalate dehydratase small subunit
MQAFTRLDARAVPLNLANIDTDQIIPKQFLKQVDREGLARGLFYDLRFDEAGHQNPDFVMNRPEYKGSEVMIAGDNFGCGSSREHAPWALMDWGIRAVIAPAFAEIFNNNSLNNGLLTVVLPAEQVAALMEEARGGNHLFTVDLESQTVISPSGKTYRFEIDAQRKDKLIRGLDAIGETLQHVGDIDAFEARAARSRPWLEART